MLNARTFSDILQDIQEQQQTKVATSPYGAGWESTLDAADFVQIMTLTHVHCQNHFTNRAKAYARSAKPPYKTQDTKEASAAPTNIRPAHALDAHQLEAFNFFKAISPKFANNFSKRQLKSVYRAALLKTHPDTCDHADERTGESFQLVKKYYPILEAFVKNEV